MRRLMTVTLACVVTVSAFAQPVTHRAASIAAIHADPSAFHGTLVEITGTAKRQGDRFVLTNNDGKLRLLSGNPIPDGDVEVRGMLLDVGRLQRDDPRLAALNIRVTTDDVYRQRWPAQGEEIVVAVTSIRRESREVVGIAVTPVPPLPLEVEFSAPIEGEADVQLATPIRLQFSRDVSVASLKDRIRITYSRSDSIERGEAQPPGAAFTLKYNAATRALEIRLTQPLERFRQVKVELLEGIVGVDGSVLKPWVLNFSTGGS